MGLENIDRFWETSGSLHNYRLDIEFDGSNWHGWQSQPDHHTIQDEIEKALSTALREPVSIVGSGRTDAGVHARGQVAHFLFSRVLDEPRILNSVNGILPDSIAVRRIAAVPATFHARYSAVARRYIYRICTVPIALDRHYYWFVSPEPDMHRMNDAAAALIGEHNFSSFCRTNSETENRVCIVSAASWFEAEVVNLFHFEIVANRFLHGMVRSIVGTLLEVGHGKRAPDSIQTILEREDRREAGFAAPARGLTLEEVKYP